MPTRIYHHTDPGLLYRTVDGDLDMFRELVAIFVRTVPSLLADADAAFAGRHWPALTLASHSIAGSAMTVGAAQLAEGARRIEAHARAGADAQLAEALAQLREELARALDELVHSVRHYGTRA